MKTLFDATTVSVPNTEMLLFPAVALLVTIVVIVRGGARK